MLKKPFLHINEETLALSHLSSDCPNTKDDYEDQDSDEDV